MNQPSTDGATPQEPPSQRQENSGSDAAMETGRADAAQSEIPSDSTDPVPAPILPPGAPPPPDFSRFAPPAQTDADGDEGPESPPPPPGTGDGVSPEPVGADAWAIPAQAPVAQEPVAQEFPFQISSAQQQRPYSPTMALPAPAEPSVAGPGPGTAGSRYRTPILIVATIVLVALVVAGVYGLTRWLGEPDDQESAGAESPTASATASPSDSSPDPSSSDPADSSIGDLVQGCTNDLCVQTALTVSNSHNGADDVSWTLDGSWGDYDAGDNAAVGTGTASYSSEYGVVTLTVVGFETPEAAAAYYTRLADEFPEPARFTTTVWQNADTPRGPGEMSEFIDRQTHVVLWYDNAGVVCRLSGPTEFAVGSAEMTVWQFYSTLPPI
ncbi:MAG: hypothetical protein ACK5KU_07205 [Beutenbergiaceae bacterium]